MKIGLFTHVCQPLANGVSISVEQLAKALRDRNHEVTIITNNYDSFSNDFSDKDKLKAKSIPIFYQNLRTPILLNKKLYAQLQGCDFDIVHSHSDFGHAMIARAYSRKNDKPLIHTYHCNYLEYAKENFGALSKPFFYIPVSLYSNMLCNTADRIIAPSIGTKELLEDSFGVRKEIDYIPNGIDISKFKRHRPNKELQAKLGVRDNDFVILSVSRLSKEKRLGDIIDILPELEDCDRIKLLIVGSGPDENRLKRKVLNKGLENVIFAGEIPYDQIQEYYNLGDIFISNSKAETQGLTIVEALASSLPTICIDTPTNEEIIHDSINGFLRENKNGIKEAIKFIYTKPRLVSAMRVLAEDSAYRFSLDKSVDKIVDIYEEEIDKKSKQKTLANS